VRGDNEDYAGTEAVIEQLLQHGHLHDQISTPASKEENLGAKRGGLACIRRQLRIPRHIEHCNYTTYLS